MAQYAQEKENHKEELKQLEDRLSRQRRGSNPSIPEDEHLDDQSDSVLSEYSYEHDSSDPAKAKKEKKTSKKKQASKAVDSTSPTKSSKRTVPSRNQPDGGKSENGGSKESSPTGKRVKKDRNRGSGKEITIDDVEDENESLVSLALTDDDPEADGTERKRRHNKSKGRQAELSDKTRIACTDWKSLKESAMSDSYK